MVAYDPPVDVGFDGSFYAQLDVEAEAWGAVFVGGSIRTNVWRLEDGFGFWPERDLYGFRAGLRLGIVEVGFRHWCTHPVMPMLLGACDPLWEGGYEEVYLRIGNGR